MEGERSHMTCPRCTRSMLVEIALTMKDRQVTMRSCSKCDSRWWASDGEDLALPRVLDLATTSR